MVIRGAYSLFLATGTFKLQMEFTEEYPNKPPTVRFISKMFHPNGKLNHIILPWVVYSSFYPFVLRLLLVSLIHHKILHVELVVRTFVISRKDNFESTRNHFIGRPRSSCNVAKIRICKWTWPEPLLFSHFGVYCGRTENFVFHRKFVHVVRATLTN